VQCWPSDKQVGLNNDSCWNVDLIVFNVHLSTRPAPSRKSYSNASITLSLSMARVRSNPLSTRYRMAKQYAPTGEAIYWMDRQTDRQIIASPLPYIEGITNVLALEQIGRKVHWPRWGMRHPLHKALVQSWRLPSSKTGWNQQHAAEVLVRARPYSHAPAVVA